MPTLDFKGKQHIYAHHLTVPYRPLVPDADRSLDPAGADDNLIIQGDNLHALKALLPRYAGRVKCIYIDPPYNTGNEGWVYNDRVNSPLMKQWLKENGPVDSEDLERHDKWLCMMCPRLHLLKELLSDDGAIFVSIDDNEQHHLRMLMDEIFGEENFLATVIWNKMIALRIRHFMLVRITRACTYMQETLMLGSPTYYPEVRKCSLGTRTRITIPGALAC